MTTSYDGNWLGAGSAALILGVTPLSVRRFAKSGLLKSMTTDIGYIFNRRDVQHLAELRASRKDGRGAVREAKEVLSAPAPAPVENTVPVDLNDPFAVARIHEAQ
jgi:DNA-binding transcriptional MerR regulator